MNEQERIKEVLLRYKDSNNESVRDHALIKVLDKVPYENYVDDEVVFQRKSVYDNESRMKVRQLLEIQVEVYDPDLIAHYLQESLSRGDTKIEILRVERAAPAPYDYLMKIAGPVEVIKALVKYFDLM